MRIALNGYFWDQPDTGSGQYLRRLWRCLPALPDAAGHTFILLRPGPGAPGDPPPRHPATRVVTCPAGPFDGRSANLAKLWWEQVGLPRAARRVGAHVLHSPYLAAPLFAPCPVVVTAHDLIPWALPAYRGSRAVRLYLRLAGAACRRARLLLADSECSRRDALRFLRLPPARVRAVPLGVEPEFGAPPPPGAVAAMRARFGLPEAYAFYIGGFDQRKDTPLLLRAWAAALPALARPGAPAPALAIAGRLPAPGGLYPDLPALARSLGLLDPTPATAAVRFLGRVSEEDKRLLLAGARLFAFPSRYEGFGYDPLEAMAAGAPVICADTTSLPEIVGAAGILIPPCELEPWTAALTRVWRDDALRADLAARGRAQAARFSPEATAAATLRAYFDAI
jgi:glycosyltransferase involved in cell wall biosynthesis